MISEYSVMAIGAHADDVELLCGGTLSKYSVLHGFKITYVMSTNNMSGVFCVKNPDDSLSSQRVPWHEMMKRRKEEAEAAAHEAYGTTVIHLDHPQRHYTNENLDTVELRFGNPPPNGIPSNIASIITAAEDPASVERLTILIMRKNPAVIFTHTVVDPNPEHSGTAWLVIEAFRNAARQGFSGSLLFAAGRHSDEAAVFFKGGDTFIDISGEWFRRKIDALAIHHCQSAGIMAEVCCSGYLDQGKSLGVQAAEMYIIHSLKEQNRDPLTAELAENLQK